MGQWFECGGWQVVLGSKRPGLACVAVALSIAATTAAAQTVFRCGATYSEKPCGEDAREVAIPGAATNPFGAAAVENRKRRAEALKSLDPTTAARIASNPDIDPVAVKARMDEMNKQLRDAEARRALQRELDDARAEKAVKTFEEQVAKYCAGRAYERPFVGMTREQMLKCTPFSKPARINRTTTAAGDTEQYVFKSLVANGFVYVTNGLVTAIQD